VEDAYRALLIRDGAFSDESTRSGGPSAPIMARIYQQSLETSEGQLESEGGQSAGVLLRLMAGRASQRLRGLTINQWIGRWADIAHSIRRESTQEMVERGLYSTEYVRDIAAGVPEVDQEATTEPNAFGDAGYDAELDEDDIEDTWRMGYEDAEPPPPTIVGDLSPEAHSSALRLVGMESETYGRLSNWGKESLATLRLISDNKSLYNQSPSVIILESGDLIVPPHYRDRGANVYPKNAGQLIKAARRNANGTINWQRGIPRGMYDEAIKVLEEHNWGVTNMQIEGSLLDLPKILSFGEWMEERDKTFQMKLAEAAEKQSATFKETHSYYPARVAEFPNQGTGVVGRAIDTWVSSHGGAVSDRYSKLTDFLDSPLPPDIKILPPSSIDEKDNPESYRVSGPNAYRVTMESLLQDWFDFKIGALGSSNPISYINQKEWDFGHSTTIRAASQISSAHGWAAPIVSVDTNGEIGAALYYEEGRQGESWHIGSAGTNAKNFTSYPFKEVNRALTAAVDNEGNSHRKAELRNLLRGWRKYGKRSPSRTTTGAVESRHAMFVFAEFARTFIKDSTAQVAETYPLTPYVRSMYSTMGFVDGERANRLNILWTLAYYWPDMMPRDANENMITKSIIDNSDTYSIINEDNSLRKIQYMLDDLMKENTRSSVTDEEIADQNDKESESQRKSLGLTRAEYREFLMQFNFMLSGTGQLEEDEEES